MHVYRCARIKINEMLTAMRHTIRISCEYGANIRQENSSIPTHTHRHQNNFLLSFSLLRCACVCVWVRQSWCHSFTNIHFDPYLKRVRSDCDVHETNEFHSDKRTHGMPVHFGRLRIGGDGTQWIMLSFLSVHKMHTCTRNHSGCKAMELNAFRFDGQEHVRVRRWRRRKWNICSVQNQNNAEHVVFTSTVKSVCLVCNFAFRYANHPPHGCVSSSLSAAVRALLLMRSQWKVYASHCRSDTLIGCDWERKTRPNRIGVREFFPRRKVYGRCEWYRIGKRHKNRGPKQIDVVRHNHSSLSAKTIRTTGWFNLMFSQNRNCMGAKWFTFKIIVQ